MSSSAPGSTEEGEKVKRPMNAFILWSRKRRRELASEDPNMHNFEISKRLGIEWNRLEAKAKKQFYDEAQKLKEEHRKSYPDYKYHPRRKPRRRFTPVDPAPHFRMAYLLPSERGLQDDQGNLCPFPGYQSFSPNPHHWMSSSMLQGFSNNVPSERSLLHSSHSSHQLELRYIPQPYMMNGGVPLPGYYGIPEFSKVPTSYGVPIQQGELCRQVSEKESGIPLEMLARFSPTGLMKREALLRRAAEGSLEFRMRAGKDEPGGGMDPIDHALEPGKPTVHFEEVKNIRSGFVPDGFHRHVSSGHVCLGCQGNVPFYQGARSTSTP